MERRNNLEITAEILELAEAGERKSHIAYRANLNYMFLGRYLERLEDQGLIVRDAERGGRITTTEKGVAFLQHYKSLLQLQCGNM